MPINTVEAYQQVLSMALEERSAGYQDLVSNSNALLNVMKRKGLWKEYSGPRIRETLQIAKPDGQWYAGYDFLNSGPIELFNDAYFTPKMVAVPVSLAFEEILNNAGTNLRQLTGDALDADADRLVDEAETDQRNVLIVSLALTALALGATILAVARRRLAPSAAPTRA